MFQKLLASAFFGLGLLAFSALGQPPETPGQAKKKGGTATTTQGESTKSGSGSTSTPKTDQTDALIQAALSHDADVKMAQAKVQLAEAELAKARQAVVLNVMTLNATIQDLRSQVQLFTQNVAENDKSVNAGLMNVRVADEARLKLERTKNALSKSEMELKLITGGINKGTSTSTGTTSDNTNAFIYPAEAQFNHWTQGVVGVWRDTAHQTFHPLNTVEYSVPLSAKGPIPERIRTALDLIVKLAPKGEEVSFAKALEVFKKETGAVIPARIRYTVQPILSEGEELPIGAWFQIFADNNPDLRIVVREYGLLVTVKDGVPQDALTLSEFWKRPVRKDTEPAAKKEAILRKYHVPPSTAEALAKTLQAQHTELRILPLTATNEILVLATEAEHATLVKQLNELNDDKKPEGKMKNPLGQEKK